MKRSFSSPKSHRGVAVRRHVPAPFQPLRVGRFVLAAAVLGPAATAQTLDNETARPLNRFGLSARFGFNFEADFKNRGGGALTDPGPGPGAGGGFDHFYDDGFVRPDATYPASGGLTTFWSYDDPGQDVGGAIAFHSASAISGGSSSASADDPSLGFELSYARELGAREKFSWGVEGAFGMTDLSVSDSSAMSGMAMLTTDTFALPGGGPPPTAPFTGSFTGPNAFLAETATPPRTVATVPATVTGRRELEVNLYGLRVGPYIQFPVWEDRLAVQLGAGVALAMVDSEFSFDETTTTAGGGPVRRTGSDSDSGFEFGGYVSAELHYRVQENVGLFGGLQFQGLTDHKQEVSGKQAELSLGQSWFAQAGVTFSF